jgi:hypothetical protein
MRAIYRANIEIGILKRTLPNDINVYDFIRNVLDVINITGEVYLKDPNGNDDPLLSVDCRTVGELMTALELDLDPDRILSILNVLVDQFVTLKEEKGENYFYRMIWEDDNLILIPMNIFEIRFSDLYS